MEAVLEILNTPVISFGDDRGLTVLQILVALLVLLGGSWLARWTEKKVSKRLLQRQIDAGVVQLVRRLFYIVVIAVLVFMTLDLLGIPLAAFAFVTGAIAIGVGFGAQNIINNFISGWILMGERPIRVGDFLELGAHLGTVEAINIRYTRVRRLDGVRLMIPNSEFLENTVINWTIVDRKLRSSVRVGVRYGSDPQTVKNLLDEVLAANPDVIDTPKPTVIFEDFGESALIFDAFFWIESSSERSLRGVRSDLRFEIDKTFKANDVVIAFPQRDVHVDGQLTLKSEDDPAADEYTSRT